MHLDTFKREGEDLKADWTSSQGRRYIVPDGFIILADSRPNPKNLTTRYAFFLEVDRSTMDAKRMAGKFERYVEMYNAVMHRTRFNVPTFRVLTVCKSRQRAENLRKLVRGEFVPPHSSKAVRVAIPKEMRSFFYFIDEHAYLEQPQNILAATWLAGHSERPEAVIPRPLSRLSS